MINHKVYDFKVEEPKKTYTPRVVNGNVKKNKYSVSKDTQVTLSTGEIVSGVSLDALVSDGRTHPCHCIYPENHPNGDKTPSAFVTKHENGHTMMKCSGCGALAFFE